VPVIVAGESTSIVDCSVILSAVEADSVGLEIIFVGTELPRNPGKMPRLRGQIWSMDQV